MISSLFGYVGIDGRLLVFVVFCFLSVAKGAEASKQPVMGGGEIFEGLKRIDQSVKVILSSGCSVNS